MKTLIRNARIIDHQSDRPGQDCYMIDGLIHTIGKNLNVEADHTIDATGLWLIPGGIDPHTHLDMPLNEHLTSSDDFFTGTVAAALGGTTTILDFPTQTRGRKLLEAAEAWHAKAHGKATIDYGFHAIVTDTTQDTLDQMAELTAQGIQSFKFFMAYPDSLMLDDPQLFRAFRYCAELGVLPMLHAESGQIIDLLVREAIAKGSNQPIFHAKTRPELLESEAIYRAGHLAILAGCPLYIVHLSSASGWNAVRQMQKMGCQMTTETCPQYLFLDERAYELENCGHQFIMSPPLRSMDSPPVLRKAILSGDLNILATDHCPFLDKPKRNAARTGFHEIPNGGPGIETRMVLAHSELVEQEGLSPSAWVALCSTNAAKQFGLFPRKGSLEIGTDADICLFDPKREQIIHASSHHMNVDYSLFEGKRVRGSVRDVWLRGTQLVEKGRFIGQAGLGQYLKR